MTVSKRTTASLRTRLTAALAIGAALTMSACGAAPGSVTNDPLSQKVIDAEAAMRSWAGVGLSMTFQGSGRLASASLPCISMRSNTSGSEQTSDDTFEMQLVKNPSSGRQCTAGSGSSTTSLRYVDGILYSSDDYSTGKVGTKACASGWMSHTITGDLAEQFVADQTASSRMTALMDTATAVEQRGDAIHFTLDTDAVIKLGKANVPSGADTDDYTITADVRLDGQSMKGMTMRVSAGSLGSLDVIADYSELPAARQPTAAPASDCVIQGPSMTSMDDLKSLFR